MYPATFSGENPLDPMCLAQLPPSESDNPLPEFLKKIGLDESFYEKYDEAVATVMSARPDTDQHLTIADVKFNPSDKKAKTYKAADGSVPKTPSSKTVTALPKYFQLSKRGADSIVALNSNKSWNAIDAVTGDGMKVTPNENPKVSIEGLSGKKLLYSYAQTQGFYELHKTISGRKDTFHTQVLVTDGAAPDLPSRKRGGVEVPFLAADTAFAKTVGLSSAAALKANA